MTSLALLIPDKEVSAWVAEIDPKGTRAWLDSLPLADSGDAARDIYQALYTLNRLDLTAQTRLELMELYRNPVAMVSSVLQSKFTGLALPLPPTARQLAEFIRQLHMEMAIGYKCAIHDLQATRRPWGKKSPLALASERALRYLGEVLLRSYQVYMPPPAGVWKEVHAFYRYAEQEGTLAQAVEVSGETSAGRATISQRYLQIVLSALCDPYQLPQNECNHIKSFLETRADKAAIGNQLDVADPVGHFLIDLSVDAPPAPFPQDRPPPSADLRVLNTIELARTIHGFIKRLKQGESGGFLKFGSEMSNVACRDILRRMIKFWGLTPKRVYSRTKTHGIVALCTGINALHFFTGGRKPFMPPDTDLQEESKAIRPAARKIPPKFKSEDATSVPPEAEAPAERSSGKSAPPGWLSEARVGVPDMFPVDRWHLRDESARGLLLVREGDVGAQVRVGDLLGIQDSSDGSVWRVGVIRWIKSPDTDHVEMGVERLAPSVTPVAVKPASHNKPGTGRRYTQALLLPAMPVLQRPATLIVARGVYEPGRSLHLAVDGEEPRIVRPVKLLERTASFDQILFTAVDLH